MEKIISVQITAGDEVTLKVDLEGDQIKSTKWEIIGHLDLLKKAKSLSESLSGTVSNLEVPQGRDPASLILKELVMKLKGTWPDEPKDPELCHCRKVSQVDVERAVILGAHDVETLRQRSSANTGCGTCLPDVEDVLKQYLS